MGSQLQKEEELQIPDMGKPKAMASMENGANMCCAKEAGPGLLNGIHI